MDRQQHLGWRSLRGWRALPRPSDRIQRPVGPYAETNDQGGLFRFQYLRGGDYFVQAGVAQASYDCALPPLHKRHIYAVSGGARAIHLEKSQQLGGVDLVMLDTPPRRISGRVVPQKGMLREALDYPAKRSVSNPSTLQKRREISRFAAMPGDTNSSLSLPWMAVSFTRTPNSLSVPKTSRRSKSLPNPRPQSAGASWPPG